MINIDNKWLDALYFLHTGSVLRAFLTRIFFSHFLLYFFKYIRKYWKQKTTRYSILMNNKSISSLFSCNWDNRLQTLVVNNVWGWCSLPLKCRHIPAAGSNHLHYCYPTLDTTNGHHHHQISCLHQTDKL